MAVDVSAVVADISAQSGPIFAVGLTVVLVYVGIRLYRWVFAAIGVVSPSVASSSRDVAFFDTAQTLAKEDRKAAEFYVAAADHGGVAGYVQHMDAVEAGYHRMWAEQAASAVSPPSADASSSASVSFGRTYDEALSAYWSFTSEERALTDKLQAMGNSLEEAVHKMDLRSDAIGRSVIRARGYE